jgi:hypothetical protein
MTTTAPPTVAEPEPPVLRVVHGSPTDEEIGVLVAVLSAVGEGGGAPEPEPASRWAAPSARLAANGPGRGAWRFSGMPR